ncbi:MAG: hypothetical protein ACRC1M_08340 [Methanobacteriaceae archaeon]
MFNSEELGLISDKSELKYNIVNYSSENIAIFKQLNTHNYNDIFVPSNQVAIKYSLRVIDKNIMDIRESIAYQVSVDDDREEFDNIILQYNQLEQYLSELKVKSKGDLKVNKKILIYLVDIYDSHNHVLIPLNENSRDNIVNVYNLINKTPNSNKDIWNILRRGKSY